MNFTYEQLREKFEKNKMKAKKPKAIKKAIAAYLIQESSVSNPKTARQISNALNIPIQTIINMLWNAEVYARILGYEFFCTNKEFYNDYNSITNPSDMIRLKSNKNVYWAEKMKSYLF